MEKCSLMCMHLNFHATLNLQVHFNATRLGFCAEREEFFSFKCAHMYNDKGLHKLQLKFERLEKRNRCICLR